MKSRWFTNFGVAAGCIAISIFFATTSYAHPGGTAADGCHYCRSNCERWGEVRNQRHCHNQSNTNTSKVQTNRSRPTNEQIKLGIQNVRLVRVIDGDTIEVRAINEGRQIDAGFVVRLANIDAPEKNQPGGSEATVALRNLVRPSDFTVKTLSKGRYGRAIALIFVSDKEINREMVARGWAWVYDQYNSDPSLDALEANARMRKLGVWGLANTAIPPWEWRE